MSKSCPSPTETATFLLFDKNRLRFPEVVDRVVGLVEQRLFYWIHGPGIMTLVFREGLKALNHEQSLRQSKNWR